MYIYEEEYQSIFKAIKYYVSKFVKIGNGFMDEINIRDFDIKKIDDNFYQFTYDISFDKTSISDIRFISGTISKKYVKLLAKKTVQTNNSNKFVSYITIKIGEFVIDNNLTKYSDLYATINSYGDSEKIESIGHHQKYNFKTGNLDLLTNYSNLVPIKWPILNFNTDNMVKKLQKC